MTREQIDAIERLYNQCAGSMRASIYSSIPELLAAARRALELEEALVVSADIHYLLARESDGSYTCWRSGGDGNTSQPFTGTTPLEAIQNARRGM